ncbi:MAG: biopolymer transporter ExbD [Pseudomonadota bacterium]|nr:biopolymer transporter ExbD [Pseudomonadota bacterium]
MAVRRLRKTPAHLEITAFINLIVVLVPFLLSVSVFTHLAVIDLALPAQSNEKLEQLDPNKLLKLEVVIRPESIEVGDRIGGLIQRIPNLPAGADVKTLSALIQGIKLKFPEQSDATVLSEPNTSYDALVQVMDAVRSGAQVQGAKIVRTDYFPNISIGDAPIRKPS